MTRGVASSRQHIVLVGLMGSGKTTVGRELASLLARPLIDSDAQVREMTGEDVAEISRRAGVSEMRRLEHEALTRALASPDPAVIAAAAGVVLEDAARRLLSEASVGWLKASPETLAERVGGAARPLLGDDPLAVLREMERQRRHLYERVADIVIDVDALSPTAAALRIAQAVPVRVRRDGPS